VTFLIFVQLLPSVYAAIFISKAHLQPLQCKLANDWRFLNEGSSRDYLNSVRSFCAFGVQFFGHVYYELHWYAPSVVNQSP